MKTKELALKLLKENRLVDIETQTYAPNLDESINLRVWQPKTKYIIILEEY